MKLPSPFQCWLIWLACYLVGMIVVSVFFSWIEEFIYMGIMIGIQVLLFRWSDKVKARKRQQLMAQLNSASSMLNQLEENVEPIEDNPSDRRSKDESSEDETKE